jgi:hypothetical protein
MSFLTSLSVIYHSEVCLENAYLARRKNIKQDLKSTTCDFLNMDFNFDLQLVDSTMAYPLKMCLPNSLQDVTFLLGDWYLFSTI